MTRALPVVLLAGVLACAAPGPPRGPGENAELAVSSFEDLRRLVETRHPRTVEELVAALPVSLRQRHVLLDESLSLQAASRSAPRVLLFDEAVHLVLAFQGGTTVHHAHAGASTVDVLEADPAGAAVLHEIVFPGEAGGTVQLSGPNPPVCVACHGAPPRPIWGSFQAQHAHDELSPVGGAYAHLLGGELSHFEEQVHAYEGGGSSPGAELRRTLEHIDAEVLAGQWAAASSFPELAHALLGLLLPECEATALSEDRDNRALRVEVEATVAHFPRGASRRLAEALARHAVSRDPGAVELARSTMDSHDCRELARRSREDLRRFVYAPSREARPRAVGELLAECRGCHDGTAGPPLAFGDTQVAGQALLRLGPEVGARRMPLGRRLLADEESSLSRYFEELAARRAPDDRAR